MSYCVNCGVELAASEKECPLCKTRVMNPNEPWKEPRSRPYPRSLERILTGIDRKYLAAIIALCLLLPVAVTALVNLLADKTISWSAYVMGTAAMLYVMVTLPLYCSKYPLWLHIAADGAAVTLFLMFIERFDEKRWFLDLGMPIAVGTTVFTLITVLVFTSKKRSKLFGTAVALICSGLLVVVINMFVTLHKTGHMTISWSLYALLPCLILASVVLTIDSKVKLKEEIRRRLYF